MFKRGLAHHLLILGDGLLRKNLNDLAVELGVSETVAMAVGIPIIATDCPSGPAEILAGGEYGVLVPPEDPQSLAEAMISLLADQEELSSYIKKARQRVLDYSPGKITAQWDKLIDKVLHD